MRFSSSLIDVVILTFFPAAFVCACPILAICAPPALGDDKPNILFIMSDDHTSQAIGVYGSRLAPLNVTPTIDSLAKNGMRFDRVYCNNSICTPSRASIITGQYSQTNGITELKGAIPPRRQYLPIEMSKAGYSTAIIGKWHLSAEPAAFDFYAVLPGQGKYLDPTFRVRGTRPWPQNTITKVGQHSSDAITDISLEWLRTGRDPSKPFFLMHHFKAPHDMFTNAKRYDTYLEGVEIPEPASLFDPPSGSEGSRGFGSGIGRTHAPWALANRLDVPEELDDRAYAKEGYQRFLRRYLRCVKGIDDNVQRLLEYLAKAGELDNTLIMYTADQGFFLGEHDLMDKRWMYEEAFRMPLIVQWPGKVKSGSINGWLINNTDFAPTILDVAGQATPDYMQGRSFITALMGKSKPVDWRTVTYYRYWMHLAHRLEVPAHFGIRSERYKLIFFYGLDSKGRNPTPPAWEFYDLKNDPAEMSNEYDNPEYAQMIVDMKKLLRQTREELREGDTNPEILDVIDRHWDR